MLYVFGVLCLTLCGIAYTSNNCYPGCKRHSCDYGGWCNSECTVGYAGEYCDTCKIGYYKTSALCCPTNCESCSSDTMCSVCKDGWYGRTCNTPCSSNCNTQLCHIDNGLCCKQGYTGAMCDQCSYGWYRYSGRCYKCPVHCYNCSSEYWCYTCTAGYHGNICHSNCSAGCRGDTHACDKLTGYCLHGCNEGYKGRTCNQCIDGRWGENCHKHCPVHCKRCLSRTSCNSCVAGYHGDTCQSQCSVVCRGATHSCYKSTGKCTDGCIDRRWGEYCNSQCPSSCTRCSSNNFCNSCEAGYYGTACQFSCSKGCAGQCVQDTGDCHTCASGYSGSKCCVNNNYCQICSSNTECSTCIEGFYGSACEMHCPENCESFCFKNTGGCTACKIGFYGSKCDKSCLPNCVECNIDGTCKLCISGFYGTSCNQICNLNCKSCTELSLCSKCKDGFHGIDCSSSCPTTCVACNSATNCTHCKDGFTSTTCTWKCSSKCQSCSISDRNICTRCIRGRYDTNWNHKLSNCSSFCPRNCLADFCDERSGHCIGGCVSGYVGDKCECPENCQNACHIGTGMCRDNSCKVDYSGGTCSCISNTNTQRCRTLVCTSCSNNTWYSNDNGNTCCKCSGTCRNDQCKDADTCSDGCISGYYGEGCKGRCSLRDRTCLTCTIDGCLQCIDGFYPAKDSGTCVRCSEYCVNENCGAWDGICLENCTKGFWGERCDYPCDSHCKFCDRSTGVCNSCENELFTRNCSSACSEYCDRSDTTAATCDIDTGQCELGCINDTIHGQICELHCNETCTEQMCNWKTGKCTKGCTVNNYGEWCEHQCSEVCIRNAGERKCHEVNGSCVLGCKDGYFDSRCDKKCSRKCLNRTCVRSNGTCTHGCMDGYKGHNCAQALKHTQSTNFGVIAGTAAGVCVLIVIAIIVVFTSKPRSRQGRLNENETNSTTEQANIAMVVIEPVYRNMPASGLNSAPDSKGRTTLCKAETTAIENHKRSKHLRLSTISGLGDIAISVEERGESVDNVRRKPTDETYYNFEAISRKGITIECLPDYVAGKSKQEIIKEFLSIPKYLPKPNSDSQKPENLGKNRYRGIYPYDANRVRLLTGDSDYINASYINGFRKEKEYIAALGPLDVTTNHFITFWTMVWQEMVEKIVMLTNLVENTKMKCEQYWPNIGSCSQYGDISVSSMAEEKYAEFTVRIFSVTKSSERRMLYHFHYTAWPDKGVPDDVTGLIEFRNKVLAIKASLEGAKIVHCSAGVGRTGTYIALDYLTKEGTETGSVDILACFAGLRAQRICMIQAEEQYIYLHDAVVHSLAYDSQPVHSEKFKDYLKTLDPQMLQTKFNKLQLGIDRKDEAEVLAVNRNKTYKSKNNPQADIPGDRYRPKLHLSKTLGDSDYINAVYLDSFRDRNHYVVTQTPLTETIEDFLTLIHQEYIPCIVDMQPNMQTKTSIAEYLPVDGQRSKYGCFEIENVKVKSNEHFVLSRVTISRNTKSGKEQRTVHHYKYTGWDHRLAVPPSPSNFINFVREVEAKSKQEFDNGKILLHCISGAERSCLFSVVSVVLEKMESEHEVSIVNVIRQIKSRRPRAIPTKEQYLFCHQCVESFLDTFDTYSNYAARQ